MVYPRVNNVINSCVSIGIVIKCMMLYFRPAMFRLSVIQWKGHFGDNINSAVVSFVERLSMY